MHGARKSQVWWRVYQLGCYDYRLGVCNARDGRNATQRALQVHPPDVTGAQLVGADGSSPDSHDRGGYSALDGSMQGSAGGAAEQVLFPTVDDMSPTSRASDDSPHGTNRGAWFGGAGAKQRGAAARGQRGAGRPEGGMRAGWGRLWGQGGDADLEMKDVDEGVLQRRRVVSVSIVPAVLIVGRRLHPRDRHGSCHCMVSNSDHQFSVCQLIAM